MKISPEVKKTKKRVDSIKKVVARKLSVKDFGAFEDHLDFMQKQLDNVIVNCLTLGDKSYELRTKVLPDFKSDISASFNEQNKAIERLEWAVISFGIATITMAIYLAIGYFYG